ncbi:acyltransferase family protein [Pseudomonas sp. dw_358]|uniref:acyltransferase family protein n=1 Tax=Pseudomonas sp. dw_358 TaxID=2720083 RepID=UPI001BD20C2A|nr:acyltransferase family protein [Pseudomonas sp. dw_358]
MATLAASATLENEQSKATLYYPGYRADIDGLRAIAVLAVVGYHAFPSTIRGGFVGVDVFFVISGFLISSIIFNSLQKGQFSFAEFYTKRALRIFPALLIVLLGCFIAGWFTLFADEFRQLGKHILGGALFSSNLFLWNESGYFDTTGEVKPLLHLWSLGIEEQFYLAWPLVVWVIWKRKFSVLAAVTALWLISFSLNLYLIGTAPSFTFYMPQTRMWELLSGAMVAYWAQPAVDNVAYLPRLKARLKRYFEGHARLEAAVRNTAAVAGAALLATAFALVRAEDAFPGWWATLPVAGTALIILAGGGGWINRHLLSQKVVIWFGLISFPLYLWHWPLLSFSRIIEGEFPSREVRVTMMLLAVALAWLTYRFVETPIRHKRIKVPARGLYLVLIVMGGLGVSAFVTDGFKQRSNMQGSGAAFAQFVGPVWQFTNNPTCMTRYPYNGAGKGNRWFCMTNQNLPPTVLLYGNSYANHLYPGLTQTPALAGNTFLSIGNCAVGAAEQATPYADEGMSPCQAKEAHEQEDFLFDLVRHNPSLKYVIIDGLSVMGDEAYYARIDKRIDTLTAQHLKVIVFVPHLRFDTDIKECFSRFPGVKPSPACIVAASARADFTRKFQPLEDYVHASHPNVQFFDQNAAVCDDVHCSMTMNGMPVFRDQFKHYSEYASGRVAKLFSTWAMQNAPDLIAPLQANAQPIN